MNRHIAIVVASIALVLGGVKAAGAQVTEVRFAHNYPVATHLHRGAETLAKYFNEHNTRFKITIFPSGQLYEEKGLVQGIQTGALEMSFVTSAAWGGSLPAIYVANFPMLMGTDARGKAAIDGAFGKMIAAEFEKAGVHLIGWMVYGLDDIIVSNVRPLRGPDDFKGLRLRTTGSLHGIMVKALGGGPTVLSASEVYMALQRGTFDGTVTGTTSVVQRKWNEVTKFATLLPLSYSPLPITVSRRFWDKLNPEERKALQEAGRIATEQTASESHDIDLANRVQLRKSLQVVEMDDATAAQIQKLVYPAASAYIKEVAGDTGMDALRRAEDDVKNVR